MTGPKRKTGTVRGPGRQVGATPSSLRPTSVDLILAGLSPALIIGMIACLVFFLLTLVYEGDFTIRLMYILGLYTFASVLIARIAIEQNRALAMGYMLAMGAAAMLVTMRFIQFPPGMQALAFPIVLGFLILIAVLADRITFDCTVIDEQEDSSGEGLLQSLGMLKSQLRSAKSLPDTKKLHATQGKKKKNRKHNPGVWVLYFALLAVPMFGIGQLFMSSNDSTTRDRSFYFLIGYLLCALSLLVVTSFLNLRRYLRQRNVAMPTEMTLTWLASGITGVVVLLLVAMVLPLPGRAYGLFGLPFKLTSGDMKASKWGWGPEGVRDNSVQASVPPQRANQQANQQNQSSKSDRPKVAGGNDSQSGEQNAQPKANGQGQPSNESGGKEQGGQSSNDANNSSPSNSSSSKNSGKSSDSSKSQSSDGQGSKPDSSNSGSSRHQQPDQSSKNQSQSKSQPQPNSDGQKPSNAEQSKDQQQAGTQESPSAKAQSPSDSGKQPNSNNSKQKNQNQPSNKQEQNQSQSPNQKDNSDKSTSKQESDSTQKDAQENSRDQSDQSNSESSRKQSDENKDPTNSEENSEKREQQQNQEENASDEKRPEDRDAAKDAELKKQSEQKEQSAKQKNAQQDNTQSKSESSPSSSFFNSLPNLSSLVKIITALILAGIIFVYLLLHGRELLAALRGWFDRLFGNNAAVDASSKQVTASAEEVRNRQPSFSSFMNPFSKSVADGSQSEIVRYTFEAVQAWGNEHGAPRQVEETPEEYLKRLARQYPTQSTYLQSLGNLYYRLAYANRQIRIADIDPLRKLCDWLWAPKTPS